MENTKSRLNAKTVTNFLSNNAITLLILLMVIYVGFNSDNFFTWANLKNLISNSSTRFIIACGVSGCLITKGTDLSAGRAVGLGACIAATLLQKVDYGSRFFPNLPDIPVVAGLLAAMLI